MILALLKIGLSNSEKPGYVDKGIFVTVFVSETKGLTDWRN